MYIFLLSVIIVSFIAYCFFKSKFWENRYLVLLLISGVALVSTFTTNVVLKDKNKVKVEISNIKSIKPFYFSEKLKKDSVIYEGQFMLLNDNDSLFDGDYISIANDSITDIKTIIFIADSTEVKKVGFLNRKNKLSYYYFDNVYIVPSESDTISYVATRNLRYDVKSSKWTKAKLPKIETIKCLYIPPSEYSELPDSLKREIKF
jgi:hypothetical protein